MSVLDSAVYRNLKAQNFLEAIQFPTNTVLKGAQHCLHTASCIHVVVIVGQALITLLTN